MTAILNFFDELLAVFNTIKLKDIIDIVFIALLIFAILKFVKGTRAASLLKGLIILFVVYFVASIFNLTMVVTVMKVLFEFAVIIIVVVFQPEIRKALEKLGRSKFTRKYFSFIFKSEIDEDEIESIKKSIVDVSDASALFSSSKTGALIVFEREVMLSDVADSGTVLNSDTSVALLGNIFFNKAPLHDGAIIIRKGKIYAGGCILPLTDNRIDINLGTRHRAAVGISELSDAVVVVVSEETGAVSIAVNGKIKKGYDRESLMSTLEDLLIDDTKVYVKESSKFSLKRKENTDE